MPRVLTSCGEAFNYSIDKTGDTVWAGVFEKDRPNEAARFKVCADEDEAREFCKLIEGSGKLPLCMGRNAASEAAGADLTGDTTITLPEYGEELQEVSGSGRMPKSASMPDDRTVQAVVDWLVAGDLAGYDHGTAMEEHDNRYWQIVQDALGGELYDAVVAKLEADGIEGEWKEGKTAQQMPVDPEELSEEELKKRAIRDNMKAENDAILMYSAYIDLLPEGDPVRKGLEDIRDEEKEHAGELHKLLIDLDPSEEDEFNEGIGEVERETDGKDDDMEKKSAENRAARSAGRKRSARRTASRKVSSEFNYGQVFDGINVHMRSDVELDGEMTRKISQMVSGREAPFDDFSVWDEYTVSFEKEYNDGKDIDVSVRSFVGAAKRASRGKTADVVWKDNGYNGWKATGDNGTRAVLSEDGVWFVEDAYGYVLAEGEDDYEEDAKSEIERIMREARRAPRKTASGGLAPEVSYHDEELPFYAFYEGQTKDKRATIGVVQQQIGSKPQLTVISDKGQVHEFGMMPNMDYALRQAERFEKMTYNEVVSAAPPKTVRVTTAEKAAQMGGWEHAGEDYWYKYVGSDGSTVNVSWAGWTNLPGNLYYDAKGCYAYYDGTLDGAYEPSLEIARVKTVSIDGLPYAEVESMPYDQLLAKYDNPEDGFCMIEPAMEYCAKLADEWLAQNAQRLPAKTAASDGHDTGRSTPAPDGWTKFETMGGGALGSPWRFTGDGKIVNAEVEADGTYNWYWVTEDVGVKGYPRQGYFPSAQAAIDDALGRTASAKTADDGWEEEDGVWAKFEHPYEMEVDYDYSTPGKYHWELIDMTSGGASGEKMAEGDEDTLEGAKSAVTEEVGRRTGSNAALGA
nr:MAG TPA: ferritin-like protein [Caudoviricetes sp.]